MRKLIGIIACLLPVFMHAQVFQIDKPALSIDSLKKALTLLHDSARVDCLNELARSYIETMQKKNADSALTTANLAYKEASAIRYVKGLGNACLQIATISYWHDWDFFKSEKNYRQAISWHQTIHNDNGLGFGFHGLGASFLQRGNADEAMKALEQSAFHFKKAGNLVMIADLNDWFSYVYELKGDFEKHFALVKNGLREKKRLNDGRGTVWSFYNLAQIYQSVEDYETALNYMRQSFQQARQQSVNWHAYRSMGYLFLAMGNYDSSAYYFQQMLRVKPSDGSAFAGLGKLYLHKKEYYKAIDYLQQASTIKKSLDPSREILVQVDMAKAYAGMKQYTKAFQCAREYLAIARQTDNKPVMQSAFEVYWNVYEALQQKDSAYFYYRKFVTLKDSLEYAKFKRQHLQKLALYKVDVKDDEQQARIDLLNKDNQIKQQQLQKEALMKKIFAVSLAVLILLSTIVFRNIALKRRNEKHRRELAENELQIQKLESEKTTAELEQQATDLEMQALRAQMNPHFIFNCLSSINRFILKNETEAASDYLTKFSRLIRMVLTNSKKTFISLEDELDMLRLYLDMEILRSKDSFEYSISLKNEIDLENTFIPPLMLQPFAENAIWHGLMHKQGQGHLDIALSADKKILTCIITDDGIGRNKAAMIDIKSAKKHQSLGLQITTERLAILNHDIGEQSFFNIEDVTDNKGNVAGTRVILKMQYKDMIEVLA